MADDDRPWWGDGPLPERLRPWTPLDSVLADREADTLYREEHGPDRSEL